MFKILAPENEKAFFEKRAASFGYLKNVQKFCTFFKYPKDAARFSKKAFSFSGARFFKHFLNTQKVRHIF